MYKDRVYDKKKACELKFGPIDDGVVYHRNERKPPLTTRDKAHIIKEAPYSD